MQLEIPPKKQHLIMGEPYMAFVKVIPYYQHGNPQPVRITFNELIYKKQNQRKEVYMADSMNSVIQEEQLL